MTPERWRRVEQIYHAARARPAEQRVTFLAEACACDDELRLEVEGLLDQSASAEKFLTTPALAVVAQLATNSAASVLTGRQFGVYVVQEPIGTGGMGEVYRARDTKLGRDVAIKILPRTFTADPKSLARFEREARVLASLNHPNIATIHGIEDSADGRALVMELVEGPTLADRIASGPTTWAEALPIIRQITEALEAAHEQGIVHRDLKPANVKVRPDGVVKVLDFGLARVSELRGPTEPSASQIPAITGPATTSTGMIVGTPAYMSPEQVQGKPVDRHADIWALGCVLFEMLTGQRAFAGEDVIATLIRVIECKPDLAILPSNIPLRVRRVLGLCLRKDPRQRIGDVRDVRLALQGDFDTATSVNASLPLALKRPQWLLTLSGALLLMAAAAGWWLGQPSAAAPAAVRRFAVSTAPAILTIANTNRDIAVGQPGNAIVYLAGAGADRFLYVRSLDALEATPVREADGFFEPFVSHDGRWIGYIDETDFTMRKVSVAGGPPVSITHIGRELLGATWGPDNSIIFAPNEAGGGLKRVSAEGGRPTTLTTPRAQDGEVMHAWPVLLPDGQKVLYTIRAGNDFRIGALDLATGQQKIIVPSGTNPRYAPSGHLVYAVENTLRAVRFDPRRLEVQGESVAVLEGVLTKALGASNFDIAANGTLVYVSGSNYAPRRLVWVNRDGTREPLPAPPRSYVAPRISPDGSRVALSLRDEQSDIWIWDFDRRALTRVTADPGVDYHPVWALNGHTVVFTSMRTGADALYVQAADGSGTAERLTDQSNQHTSRSVSPDGSQVIFDEVGPDGSDDLMALQLAGRRVVPLLRTPANERNGQVSPDSHWLAYESDESGRFEVYVRPYPNLDGGRWPISNGGGVRPVFTRHGSELIFQADGRLMGAALRTAGAFAASVPVPVVEGGYYSLQLSATSTARAWDVSPDGNRFLMIEAADAELTGTTRGIVVVLNWTEELKRLLPAP